MYIKYSGEEGRGEFVEDRHNVSVDGQNGWGIVEGSEGKWRRV